MKDPDISDLTLDEIRPLLARELPRHAGFDGWNDLAVESAAAALGLKLEIARLVFENRMTMIDGWFATVDVAMLDVLPAETLARMKVRERITSLVDARLSLVDPHKEALRRALSILAMPQNVALGVKLGWRAADVMWRAAGDTATDYNHYTKRAILGSVYAATLSVFMNDESEDQAETRAFLGRRIEGIMRFEKAKAKWTAGPGVGFSPARFFGRLRYPG